MLGRDTREGGRGGREGGGRGGREGGKKRRKEGGREGCAGECVVPIHSMTMYKYKNVQV